MNTNSAVQTPLHEVFILRSWSSAGSFLLRCRVGAFAGRIGVGRIVDEKLQVQFGDGQIFDEFNNSDIESLCGCEVALRALSVIENPFSRWTLDIRPTLLDDTRLIKSSFRRDFWTGDFYAGKPQKLTWRRRIVQLIRGW